MIFLLSGLWHGANWTFVLWGAYHALLFVPLLLLNKNRRFCDTVATVTLPDGTTKTKWLPSLKEAGQMLLTFALAVVGWIIFRANSMGALTTWVAGICSSSLLTMPWLMTMAFNLPLLISILLLLVVEWSNRTKEHAFQIADYPKLLQVLLFYFLAAAIIVSMFKNELTATFIYFQF